MNEKIIITLGPGARNSTLETEGFKGGACKEAAEIFKRRLGEVQAEANTPEFYEATACENQAQAG